MDIDTIFKFLRLDNLIKNFSGYVESRVELLKLEVREEIIKVVSYGLLVATCLFLAFLFLIFVSIGIANYVSARFGDTFSGYWIVAGAYGLAGVIILLFRKNIGNFIEDHVKEQARRKSK